MWKVKPKKKSSSVLIALRYTLLVAIMLFLWFMEHLGIRKAASSTTMKSAALAMSTGTSGTKNLAQHKIFCFGDSLTAGTCPPTHEFPYAPHLEAKLENGVKVDHIGFPGWTSYQLLEEAGEEPGGLRTIIQEYKDASTPLSIVILLAGTNDLGWQRQANDIVESVVGLHQLCYEEGVPRTVLIEIPPAAYTSLHKRSEERARTVNENLKSFCEKEPRATFFPFPFGYAKGDEHWSSDGLHFSALGYKVLGESLAPVITEIIRDLEQTGGKHLL